MAAFHIVWSQKIISIISIGLHGTITCLLFTCADISLNAKNDLDDALHHFQSKAPSTDQGQARYYIVEYHNEI